MPKTPKKTRAICITLPIPLDEFLDKAVKAANERGEHLTKSSLITHVLTLSIIESQKWSEEQKEHIDSKA